jgi:hypothetical protein
VRRTILAAIAWADGGFGHLGEWEMTLEDAVLVCAAS